MDDINYKLHIKSYKKDEFNEVEWKQKYDRAGLTEYLKSHINGNSGPLFHPERQTGEKVVVLEPK